MCGIVTVYSAKRNVSIPFLIELYLRQRSRGTQGFGFSYLTKRGFIQTMRFEHEAECFAALGRIHSRLIQFHHRHPTSTKNTPRQNHPILIETKKHFYSFIHNGIVSTPDPLREEHEKEGRLYSTYDPTTKDFNDSETLAHEVVKRLESGEKYEIKARGSAAFVILQCDKNRKFQKLHFGRNFNPLFWIEDKERQCSTITSDADNGMWEARVEFDSLHTLDWPSQKTAKVRCSFPDSVYRHSPHAHTTGRKGRSGVADRGVGGGTVHYGHGGYDDGFGYHGFTYPDADGYESWEDGEVAGGVIDLAPETVISRPKDKKGRREWQSLLRDTYEFAKEVLKECFNEKRSGEELADHEIVYHLKLIDEALMDLSLFDTAKAKGLIEQLKIERARMLPTAMQKANIQPLVVEMKKNDAVSETFKQIFSGQPKNTPRHLVLPEHMTTPLTDAIQGLTSETRHVLAND